MVSLTMFLSLIVAFASLGESRVRLRYKLIGFSHCGLFVLCTQCKVEEKFFLYIAFASNLLVLFIVNDLLSHIENVTGQSIKVGQTKGLAQQFTKQYGLLLTATLLLGCNPGSLLFMIEDIVLHHAYEQQHGLVILFGVTLITLVAGVSGYQALASTFSGQVEDKNVVLVSAKNLTFHKLIIGMALFLGLVPSFVSWMIPN